MNAKLQDLYALPPIEAYLLDLVEESGRLETRLLEIAEELPEEQRQVVESYIEVRDELEFQSVKRALKFGR